MRTPNPERDKRRHQLRQRVIKAGSYRVVAEEEGMTEKYLREIAGPGLDRPIRGYGCR